MSRARHYKSGGSVEQGGGKGREMAEPAVTDAYTGANSTVVKEAKERKHGGRVKKEEKEEKKEHHKVEGKKAKMHLGRPGRKSGGRIGSNKMPLSTAAKITSNDERP